MQRSEVESGACRMLWVLENLHYLRGSQLLQSCLRLLPRVVVLHSSRSLKMRDAIMEKRVKGAWSKWSVEAFSTDHQNY